MKKILTLLAAFGLLVACLSGCGGKKADSSETDESSIMEIIIPLEMPDIDISIPEDYEETSTENNSTVYIKNDASIIVNSDVFTDNYKTLDEYVEYAASTYSSFSDGLEILSREERNNGRLMEFIYSLESENGVFSKYCMTAYFTDGEQLYLVTCKADVDTYENYRDEFLNVIDSVRLK